MMCQVLIAVVPGARVVQGVREIIEVGIRVREDSGARLKRRSISFRIETVSYSVLSMAPLRANGEITMPGTRTPTPQPSLRTGISDENDILTRGIKLHDALERLPDVFLITVGR